MPNTRYVTMADVARAAGVHVSTVSLSLRNSPLLPEATRRSVREIADRLNYRPHPDVSALMQRRRCRKQQDHAPLLAFVNSMGSREVGGTTSPFPADLLRGVRRRAAETGFRVEEFWMREGSMTPRRLSDVLHARNIRGVLFAPLPARTAALDLEWANFCVVAFGLTLTAPVYRVANDHFSAMVVAIDKCQDLGYRRIGFAVSEAAHEKVEMRWLAAYLAKQTELEHQLPPLIAANWSEPVVRSWFDEHQPDVIISNHPQPLRDWISGWGLNLPDDLGLVILSGSSATQSTSGVYERAEMVGASGVDLVATLLSQNRKGLAENPETVLVQGAWDHGNTLRRFLGPVFLDQHCCA
jgi:DNA-binding LacI/PurR family transcriptional regulator